MGAVLRDGELDAAPPVLASVSATLDEADERGVQRLLLAALVLLVMMLLILVVRRRRRRRRMDDTPSAPHQPAEAGAADASPDEGSAGTEQERIIDLTETEARAEA